jgi:limonene-1,2-epoxide hydrolase
MFNVRRSVAALFVAGGLLMLGSTPVLADSDAQKIATVQAMLRAWHDLDWERVYALFTPDGVLQSMMDEPIVGRDSLRQHIGPMAAGISRIDLKVEHIGVIGGRVFVERVDDFVFHGHHGVVPVVGVFEVEGGLVKVWREYYDRAQLLAAMGVTPAGPPASANTPSTSGSH